MEDNSQERRFGKYESGELRWTAYTEWKPIFLNFIDEFCRMFFLLLGKSQVAEKMKDFIPFFNAQIRKALRVLQSDGGGEYIAKELQGS